MLKIEQLRELGDAVRHLGYVSAWGYERDQDDKARVDRVIHALCAVAKSVAIPLQLQTIIHAAHSMEALEIAFARREGAHRATRSAVAEAHIVVAQEIVDWYRGEGAYAPEAVSAETEPAPVETASSDDGVRSDGAAS